MDYYVCWILNCVKFGSDRITGNAGDPALGLESEREDLRICMRKHFQFGELAESANLHALVN